MTGQICELNKEVVLGDLQKPGAILDGSDQSKNKDDGSSNNEPGFNLTITAVPNCSVQGATVGFPLPQDPDSNCTTLLYDV